MKTILIVTITSAFLALGLSACRTAEGVADDTTQVAAKAGHVAGHGAEKAGHVVTRAGETVEEHTAPR
jgi:predicted small secreted protein